MGPGGGCSPTPKQRAGGDPRPASEGRSEEKADSQHPGRGAPDSQLPSIPPVTLGGFGARTHRGSAGQ